MVWLIGCKGMLGTEIARQLKNSNIDYIGTDIDVDITKLEVLEDFANKNSNLDRQIKASEQKIARLETQLERKEAELKNKYGIMESTLNSLESQSNSLNNFTKQQSQR